MIVVIVTHVVPPVLAKDAVKLQQSMIGITEIDKLDFINSHSSSMFDLFSSSLLSLYLAAK